MRSLPTQWGLLVGTLAGLFVCTDVVAQTIPAGVSWDWQLQAPLDLSVEVDVLVLDPDEVSAADVAGLVARGVTPVCYVSVGTSEDWRRDADQFPSSVLGLPYDGWPGERFLDIRARSEIVPLMAARFQRCADMGFQAIEPDNIDLHINQTGFPLTRDDVIAYVRLLADLAHDMGVMIAQKNAPDLVPDLARVMDFAITENCVVDGWCAAMQVYPLTGRAVLAAEYTGVRPAACVTAASLGLSLIFKRRDLTRWRRLCPR